ncbi:MAG TPA: HAD hydrolase family protein, partial [Egibacteraceae bacterium]|nr:HAD hydrolase family protein [Egibacteraceae bacterium]
VYVDEPGVEVVVGERPSTHRLHLDYIGEGLGRACLSEVVRERPVYAFSVLGAEDAPVRVAAAAVGHAGIPWVSVGTLFPGTHISVRPPGVSKWAGVLAWCADQGIDPAHVLAVGDGENDLELLEAARVSCVVSDGCEAALALADHVIEPAEHGGWRAILELLA